MFYTQYNFGDKSFFSFQQKNTKAPQAAGKIHTDFEKGFIMAEVMAYNDFKEHESESAVKVSSLSNVFFCFFQMNVCKTRPIILCYILTKQISIH